MKPHVVPDPEQYEEQQMRMVLAGIFVAIDVHRSGMPADPPARVALVHCANELARELIKQAKAPAA